MTVFALTGSIQFARENSARVYACFLDAHKAFDKTWLSHGFFCMFFCMFFFFSLYVFECCTYLYTFCLNPVTMLSCSTFDCLYNNALHYWRKQRLYK